MRGLFYTKSTHVGCRGKGHDLYDRLLRISCSVFEQVSCTDTVILKKKKSFHFKFRSSTLRSIETRCKMCPRLFLVLKTCQSIYESPVSTLRCKRTAKSRNISVRETLETRKWSVFRRKFPRLSLNGISRA